MADANTVQIERRIDGVTVIASAEYDEQQDGWMCRVQHPDGGEQRGPVNDAYAELIDMVDLAVSEGLDEARKIYCRQCGAEVIGFHSCQRVSV